MNKFARFRVADVADELKRLTRKVSRVFIHCSASDRPEHDSAEVMEQWHLERGFREIGYHLFIRKNGDVQYGRDWNKVPAAQAGNNSGTLAICLHGLAKDAFTTAQFAKLRSVCSEINKHSRVTFHGHCEVAAKACPVFDYKAVLSLDDKGVLNGSRTKSVEPPVLQITDSGNDVATLQYWLNEKFGSKLEVDGLFGQMTNAAVRRFQAARGLTVDGIAGPKTWAVLLGDGDV